MCRNWDLFQELLVKLMFINKKFTLDGKRERGRPRFSTHTPGPDLPSNFIFLHRKQILNSPAQFSIKCWGGAGEMLFISSSIAVRCKKSTKGNWILWKTPRWWWLHFFRRLIHWPGLKVFLQFRFPFSIGFGFQVFFPTASLNAKDGSGQWVLNKMSLEVRSSYLLCVIAL